MIDTVEIEKVKSLFETCSPVFLALGDEQRQKLLLDMTSNVETGISVNTLASMSSLSRPAVSHHLKVLKNYGLVVCEKKGTQVFYKLNLLEASKNVRYLLDEIEKIAFQIKEKK